MIIHLAVGQGANFVVERLVVRHVEIGNLAAGFADKMIMWFDRAVIAIIRASHLKLANQALLNENVEIAIDIAQTERRNLAPQFLKNHDRGRVALRVVQKIKNAGALLAVAIFAIGFAHNRITHSNKLPRFSFQIFKRQSGPFAFCGLLFAFCYAWNELPQPQVRCAFGFLKVKPEPCKPSVKSISVPSK